MTDQTSARRVWSGRLYQAICAYIAALVVNAVFAGVGDDLATWLLWFTIIAVPTIAATIGVLEIGGLALRRLRPEEDKADE